MRCEHLTKQVIETKWSAKRWWCPVCDWTKWEPSPPVVSRVREDRVPNAGQLPPRR